MALCRIYSNNEDLFQQNFVLRKALIIASSLVNTHIVVINIETNEIVYDSKI